MIDAELSLAGGAGISVGSRDDVRRSVADTQVQDLALLDNSIKRIHDLLDAGGPVPPVDVQNVNPFGVELLQGVAQGNMKRTLMVARGVEGSETLPLLVADVVGSELCGDDHLISVRESAIIT